MNALYPVALRWSLFSIWSFYYNYWGNQPKSIKKTPDRSQEPSNTGGELFNRNFSSLNKVSGITATRRVNDSTWFSYQVLGFILTLIETTLSTVYIKMRNTKRRIKNVYLFEFAVGVRLLMFVVFVACVLWGECPCLCIWYHAKESSFGELALWRLYSIFFSSWSPMLSGSFLLWF